MRYSLFGAFVGAMLSVVASGAHATVLTFDDIAGNGNPLPNGYGGFNWNNMTTIAPLTGTADGNSGYETGTVSFPNVVYNWNGTSPSEIASDIGPFTFNGAYFTAAWENETLTFVGELGGVIVDTSSVYSINTAGPIYISLNWSNIDELLIYNTGEQWAMDNFTFNENVSGVPAPGALTLLGFGLAGLGASRRRKAK